MNCVFFSFRRALIFALTLIAQQAESPLPELPADVLKDVTLWTLLTDKTPAGQDAVWTTPSGDVVEFFQFNDCGRGPKTYSTYRFRDRGSYEQTHGVDYMKNQINESGPVRMKVQSRYWRTNAGAIQGAGQAGDRNRLKFVTGK